MNDAGLDWPSRYVGLPFIDGGRTFEGVDCWGLVRLVLKEECGIDVPSYGEISAEEMRAIAGMVQSECQQEPWVHVHPSSKRTFDVVLMRRNRALVHVGILTCTTKMLHIEQKTDAVMVSLDHPSIGARVASFYRHRNNL